MRTTSPKRLDKVYPERTFRGRDRISLVPRWVSNWMITSAVLYFMGSYILRFMGFDNFGFDPFAMSAGAASYTATPTPLPDYPLNDQGSFYASSDPNGYVGSTPTPPGSPVPSVEQIQPTYTPYPTLTPYPTQRPFFGKIMAIGYSYYYPPFGPPNCAQENWKDDMYCEDTTASGLPWSDYIGRGVAVPLAWADLIPLGSTVRVHSPDSMVGDYVVLDYCGGCIKPEGHIYFDFLDNRARLNWTVPMLVEIILP